MKIVYQKGDLLKTEFGAILHGVNTAGVMGAGVARAMKNAYPKMYDEYALYCQAWKQNRDVMMGKVIEWDSGDKIILSGFSQHSFGSGKQVSYDAIDDIMKAINQKFRDRVVAMPMIGAGLGGGAWSVIEAIIEDRSTSFKPVVYCL